MNRFVLCIVLILGYASLAFASGYYLRGDYVIIGNTFGQECSAGTPTPVVGTVGACGLLTADSGIDVWWTIDSGVASANSSVTQDQKKSTAVLDLPDSATVVQAILFYTGFSTTADLTVTLSRTASFSQSVSGASCSSVSLVGTANECNVDITSIVSDNGEGPYTVSGLDTDAIFNLNNNVLFSNWWMLVLYEAESEPIRYIDWYNSLVIVQNGSPRTATLSGFIFPSSGNSDLAKLSIVGYEGDSTTTGDSVSVNGETLSSIFIPADNFFSSSRSEFGVAVSVVGDLPQLTGTQKSMGGIDMHTLDITDKLTAGDTSLDIEVASSSDTVIFSTAVISVEYDEGEPQIIILKTISADSGVVTVSIDFKNNGTLFASGTSAVISFSDLLYIPGSITLEGVPRGDAEEDDDDASYADPNMNLSLRDINVNTLKTVQFTVTEPTTADLILTVTIDCDFADTGVPQQTVTYTIVIPQPSSTSGDPHFFGLLGQKYDVMGESFEIYNIITAPYMQINSRFTPYYKTATQTTPTGTMMGELGLKFLSHTAIFNSNTTVATIDRKQVDLTQSWKMTFDQVTLEIVNKKFYEIVLTTPDLVITFIRKVYMVSGLEPQFHFDYKLRQLQQNRDLHGLLGQTWEDKVFTDKKGAFQFLDGYEDDYRIKSNSLLGDDFKYNKFMNM